MVVSMSTSGLPTRRVQGISGRTVAVLCAAALATSGCGITFGTTAAVSAHSHNKRLAERKRAGEPVKEEPRSVSGSFLFAGAMGTLLDVVMVALVLKSLGSIADSHDEY
jgi:hypothetical protein